MFQRLTGYAGIWLMMVYACGVAWAASAGDSEKSPQSDGVLKVLDGDHSHWLYDNLLKAADKQFAARHKALEQALASREAALARQAELLANYRKILGDFPAKTPLNAEVTGTLDCDGYRIEKVVYESRPGMHVTANLYVPSESSGPWPGILFVCGHSENGKAYESYQQACILLVKNGFVVFNVDPLCQGERYQYLDEQGKPATRGGTTTHSLLDVGAKLVGTHFGCYEMWDNIRGIDYLQSRSEVDPEQIGCTGNSGGGTQTTFIMPYDERIDVAAPSCFIMTRERLYADIGPADGCQNFADEGLYGIEHADYVMMRAPKPTILLAAEHDFFDINATRQAYAEAKKFYTVLGYPDRVSMFSFDDKHGFSKPRRQAMVRWMRKWFYDDDREIIEGESVVQPEEALYASKTGQVVSSYPGELTVDHFNLALGKELARQRAMFWWSHSKEEALAEVSRLIGLRQRQGEVTVESRGTIDRNGYRIEKLVIRDGDEIMMPALLFVPSKVEGKVSAVVMVDSRGKAAEAGEDGLAANYLRQGKIVLAVDVRGYGETRDDPTKNSNKHWNREHRTYKVATHIGRSLVGQRVEDIRAALDVLMKRKDVKAVSVVGIEQGGVAVLHAAALDDRIGSLTMIRSIRSWLDVAGDPLSHDRMGLVVAYALETYDLPDLVRSLSPRRVTVIDPEEK